MKKLLALAALAAFGASAQANTLSNYRVDLSLAGLSGSAPFGLEFDLSTTGADGFSTVVESNFVENGATLKTDASNSLSYIFSDFSGSVTSLSFDLAFDSNTALSGSKNTFLAYVYDGATTSYDIDGKGYVTFDLYEGMSASDVSVHNGSGANFSVTAVPEPSTYGLLGAGAAAAVAVVRRRRKAA